MAVSILEGPPAAPGSITRAAGPMSSVAHSCARTTDVRDPSSSPRFLPAAARGLPAACRRGGADVLLAGRARRSALHGSAPALRLQALQAPAHAPAGGALRPVVARPELGLGCRHPARGTQARSIPGAGEGGDPRRIRVRSRRALAPRRGRADAADARDRARDGRRRPLRPGPEHPRRHALPERPDGAFRGRRARRGGLQRGPRGGAPPQRRAAVSGDAHLRAQRDRPLPAVPPRLHALKARPPGVFCARPKPREPGMPGKVVRVRRRERLGWAERLYLPMIFVGLAVTARVFFRNLWGYVRGRKRTFVVEYPEERVDHVDAFRGYPVLVALEDG